MWQSDRSLASAGHRSKVPHPPRIGRAPPGQSQSGLGRGRKGSRSAGLARGVGAKVRGRLAEAAARNLIRRRCGRLCRARVVAGATQGLRVARARASSPIQSHARRLRKAACAAGAPRAPPRLIAEIRLGPESGFAENLATRPCAVFGFPRRSGSGWLRISSF